jgi:hypothetical protein
MGAASGNAKAIGQAEISMGAIDKFFEQTNSELAALSRELP